MSDERTQRLTSAQIADAIEAPNRLAIIADRHLQAMGRQFYHGAEAALIRRDVPWLLAEHTRLLGEVARLAGALQVAVAIIAKVHRQTFYDAFGDDVDGTDERQVRKWLEDRAALSLCEGGNPPDEGVPPSGSGLPSGPADLRPVPHAAVPPPTPEAD